MPRQDMEPNQVGKSNNQFSTTPPNSIHANKTATYVCVFYGYLILLCPLVSGAQTEN